MTIKIVGLPKIKNKQKNKFMKTQILTLLLLVTSINVFAQTCEQQYPNIDYALIQDCNGVCVPANWSGDNACDDGSFMFNISEDAYCQTLSPDEDNYCEYIADLSGYEFVFLNCEEAELDGGDCEPIAGCTDSEACNFNSNNATVEDGSCKYEDCSCSDYNLSINILTTEDCNGNCAPENWIGDTYCDENNFMFNVETATYCQTADADGEAYCENIEDLSGYVLINLFCEETSFDDGDCESVSLNELSSETTKKLVKIVDILGRRVDRLEIRQVKFYIYDDGTSKKVINLNK